MQFHNLNYFANCKSPTILREWASINQMVMMIIMDYDVDDLHNYKHKDMVYMSM